MDKCLYTIHLSDGTTTQLIGDKALDSYLKDNVSRIKYLMSSKSKTIDISGNKELRTFDFGDLKGSEQTQEKKNLVNEIIIHHPDSKIGGGDSFNEFQERVIPFVKDLIKNSVNGTTIVTHNSVFGLIKLLNKYNYPDSLSEKQREEYVKQDTKPGSYFKLKGENGDIYIVRHGETTDNATNRFRQDETDLTNKGKLEIKQTAEKLLNVSKIVASNIRRAISTASVIKEIQEISNIKYSKSITNEAATTLNTINELIKKADGKIRLDQYLSVETNDRDRYYPEYIKEKRIENTKKKAADYAKAHGLDIEATVKDAEEKVLSDITSEENLGELSGLTRNYIFDYLKASFNKENITIESAMAVFRKKINDYYTTRKENITEESANKIIYDATKIASKLCDQVKDGDEILVNVNLSNDKLEAKLHSDLMIIKSDGTVQTYRLSLGKSFYKDWDSAKKLRFDYDNSFMFNLLGSSGIKLKNPYVLSLIVDPDLTKAKFYSESKTNDLSLSRNFNDSNFAAKVNKIIPYTPAIQMSSKENELLNNAIEEDNIKMFDDKYQYASKFTIQNVENIINNFKLINGKIKYFDRTEGKYKYIEGKTEEETREKAKAEFLKYVERENKDKNSRVISFYKQLVAYKKDGKLGSEILGYDIAKHRSMYNMFANAFKMYIENDWDIIESQQLLANGIIAFKSRDNVIELVSLTVNPINNSKLYNLVTKNLNNPKDPNNKRNGTTVLGKYVSDEAAHSDQFIDVLPATTENLEGLRVLNVINHMADQLKQYRIGTIKIVNCMDGAYHQQTEMTKLISNFNKLADYAKISNNNYKLKDCPIKFISILDNIKLGIESITSNTPDPRISGLFTAKDSLQGIYNVRGALKLKADLENAFPYLAGEKISSKNIDFSRPEVILLMHIEAAILANQEIPLVQDWTRTNYGASVADLLDPIRTLFSNNISPEIDRNGKFIQGFLGGNYFSSIDSLPSEFQRNLAAVLTEAMNKYKQSYIESANKINNITESFYKANGSDSLKHTIIGQDLSLNNTLLLKNDDGTINEAFRVRNFWKDNGLTDHQKKYLETMTFLFNVGTKFDDEVRFTKYLALLKQNGSEVKLDTNNPLYKEYLNEKPIQNAIQNESYFNIPLRRGSDISRISGMTKQNLVDQAGKLLGDYRDFIDSRKLTPIQRKSMEKQTSGFTKMWNVYRGSDAEGIRHSVLNEMKIEYFEKDLNTVALDVIFSRFREIEFDKALPIYDAGMGIIQFFGGLSGKNVDPTLEFLNNIRKSNVFEMPLIGEESENLIKAVAIARRVTQFTGMALKPAQLLKELTIGLEQNLSRAILKVYGDPKMSFGIDELKQAYGMLINADHKFDKHYNLYEALNNWYAIVNMDSNSLVDKTKWDRNGLSAGVSKWLYWFSNSPDYMNRMSCWIAQMIKDGCFEAHSVDEIGNLKYNFNKDKRFELFNKYKKELLDNDVNKRLNIPVGVREKAIDQMSLYKIMRQEFITSGYDIKLGEALPMAYTTKQKESLKSYSDTLYGYYDHDRKSMLFKTSVGIIFMQFQTFWTGRRKLWLGKPNRAAGGTGANTAEGYYVQKTDETGKPLWKKDVYDENGNLIDIIETTENDGTLDKVLYWKGSMMEGLAYSLIHAAKDVATGKYKQIDPKRKNQALLALHDLTVFAVLTATAGALIYSSISQHKKKKLDEDEEYNLALATQRLLGTVGYKVGSEFNPVGSILGAFSWTPQFATNAQNMLNDSGAVIFGDKSLFKAVQRNFSFMEVFPQYEDQN